MKAAYDHTLDSFTESIRETLKSEDPDRFFRAGRLAKTAQEFVRATGSRVADFVRAEEQFPSNGLYLEPPRKQPLDAAGASTVPKDLTDPQRATLDALRDAAMETLSTTLRQRFSRVERMCQVASAFLGIINPMKRPPKQAQYNPRMMAPPYVAMARPDLAEPDADSDADADPEGDGTIVVDGDVPPPPFFQPVMGQDVHELQRNLVETLGVMASKQELSERGQAARNDSRELVNLMSIPAQDRSEVIEQRIEQLTARVADRVKSENKESKEEKSNGVVHPQQPWRRVLATAGRGQDPGRADGPHAERDRGAEETEEAGPEPEAHAEGVVLAGE